MATRRAEKATLRAAWLQCALLIATPVLAVDPGPAVSPTQAVDGVPVPESVGPLFAQGTQLDRAGRILAPVLINGKGPFRLMLDTGATHSTLSVELAQTLGLEPSEEFSVLLNGVTGSAKVPTVRVDRLDAGAGTIVREHVNLPVIGSRVMAGADGILGVAGLADICISVDFRRDRVIITHSRVPGNLRGFGTIPARRIDGGIFAVQARVHGVRAEAIIDTGAEHTLGNIALRDALQVRRRTNEIVQLNKVYGATTDVSAGEAGFAPTISLGGVATVRQAQITFGDFHIFDVWDLNSRPAVLIGMDILGLVDALIFDFERGELHVLPKTRHWP